MPNGTFFQDTLQNNPNLKYQLAVIDFISKRYGINPIDLLDPYCENEFLRLAYIRKIVQMGLEVESEELEAQQKKAELRNKTRR